MAERVLRGPLTVSSPSSFHRCIWRGRLSTLLSALLGAISKHIVSLSICVSTASHVVPTLPLPSFASAQRPILACTSCWPALVPQYSALKGSTYARGAQPCGSPAAAAPAAAWHASHHPITTKLHSLLHACPMVSGGQRERVATKLSVHWPTGPLRWSR